MRISKQNLSRLCYTIKLKKKTNKKTSYKSISNDRDKSSLKLITKHRVHLLGGEEDTHAAKSPPRPTSAPRDNRDWKFFSLAGEKYDRSPAALGMAGAPQRLALASS